jgi:hypothetical protein
MMSYDPETRALMKEIATEAAEEAVLKTLMTMGIDASDPIEAQRDMLALRELRALIDDPEFQKDMLHLRRWRMNMNSIESKGFLAACGMAITGFIAFIIYAFQSRLGL